MCQLGIIPIPTFLHCKQGEWLCGQRIANHIGAYFEPNFNYLNKRRRKVYIYPVPLPGLPLAGSSFKILMQLCILQIAF